MSLEIVKAKNTPAGKGLRTAYQSLLVILPLVIAVVTVPEFKSAVEGNISWTVAIVPVLTGLLAYIQNKANK